MLTGKHGQFPVAPTGGLDDNAEQFIVEFAGNGNVSFKSFGKYLSASYGNDYEGYIYCNARSVGKAEVFEWIVNEDGTISLRGHNGKFASVNKGGWGDLYCNGNFNGDSERFVVVVC
ncbi:hypothetical protein AAVH_21812 [Aphelenchoides avenae]|nr:hypothetical protein AAVH_21812 [Aphelenchus avenae]